MIRGAVLVGGRSTRMGRPKQLLRATDGRAYAEIVRDALRPHVDGPVVISGAGELPASLAEAPRAADAPGVFGPLAGLLGLFDHAPDAAWVVVACDMPLVHEEAIAWLLAQRGPDVVAVLPRTPDGFPQPLLAVYEPESRALLRALTEEPRPAPHRLSRDPRVITPAPPDALAPCWTNVNRPADVAALPPEGGA